jgi:cell division protein FtsI/penicillin-binding protein 2
MLAELGEPYQVGDIVGLSGLELELESMLAGYPTIEVRRVNQFGRIAEVLHTVPGVPSTAARTTQAVDPQLAAEEAISAVDLPAAIVAVDAETGEVRAIASRPLDGFNRALAGLYPPGSTFKVVTAAALLASDLRPADPVGCPATVTIGGREFSNAGERDLGEIDLATAFAESCNTTFAELAAGALGPEGLGEMAAAFGFDVFYQVALSNPGATFGQTPEIADVAAAAIGQGGVQVTPLHQATVAAAVAAGGWRKPLLVEGTPSEPIPLDPALVADLTEMMELVVAEGTGVNAAVEGQSVSGKTGSAEYAEGEPTHAWFIGFWDGLGIAVIVEGGGAGGQVAAPIAAEFIRNLTE